MQRKITLIRDSLPNDLFCHVHIDQPIMFVCISHQNCAQNNLLCVNCVDEMPKTHDHHLVSFGKFQSLNSLFSEKAERNLEQIREALFKLRTKMIHTIDMLMASQIGIVEDTFTTESEDLRERIVRQKISKVAAQPIWARIQERQSIEGEVEREINSEIQTKNKQIIKFVNTVLRVFDDSTRTSSSEAHNIHLNERSVQSDSINEDSSQSQNQNQKKKQRRYSEKRIGKMKQNRWTRSSGCKKFSQEQKLRIVNKISKNMPKSKLAKMYNVAYSTIRKWQLSLISERTEGKEENGSKRRKGMKEQDI